MVLYEDKAWRPARFLEHLCGIRARNLVCKSALHVPCWSFQLAVHRSPDEASSIEAEQGWHTVYTSEQVEANCNPDWAPFIWDITSLKDVELLRKTTDIHVQVYAHSPAPQCNAERPTPGHVPYRHNHGLISAPEALDTTLKLDQAQSDEPTDLGRTQHDPAMSLQETAAAVEPGKQDAARSHATDSRALSHTAAAGQPSSHEAVTLTAQVSLNDLVAFQGSLATLDVCLPPNTLVLDLKEGFCLFPSLNIQSATLEQTAVANSATSAADLTHATSPVEEPMQIARQQLVQSLLHGPPTRCTTPVVGSPENRPQDLRLQTPEVGRLKGLVRGKLGFAFGSGPDLAGMTSPAGANSQAGARRTSSQQASTSGRSAKVELAGLDTQMVRLAEKQRMLHAALAQKERLQDRLTEALQLRSTARQQRLRLEALRHAREQHLQQAARCGELKAGSARRQGLARTILRAQLQSLQQALLVLKAAYGRLGSADLMLRGPEGVLRYRPLHAHLVGRRCRVATLLGNIFRLGPQTVTVCQAPPQGFLEDQLERGWWAASDAGSSASNSSNSPRAVVVARGKQNTAPGKNGFRQMALLSVGGLDLDPLLGKGGLEGLMNWEPDRQEMRKAAAALGYTALIVDRLAQYLDVPLRFLIKPGNCRTVILSHATAAGTYRSVPDSRPATIAGVPCDIQTAFKRIQHTGITEFPLYCENADRTRFAYAIYLLNKNVEQLLNVHGLTATGASQVLANLHKLLAAAASA